MRKERRERGRLRFSRILILVVLQYVALTHGAWARTITVGLGGESEFNSIQEALKKAVDGDEIQVQPGTYQGPIKINKKSISLLGAGTDKTTVSAKEHVLDVAKASAGRISGILFEVDSAGNSGAVRLKDCGSGFVFRENRVTGRPPANGVTVPVGRNARLAYAIVIDGGAPSLIANDIDGAILAKGKAKCSLETDETVVLLDGVVTGTTTFNKNGVSGVDVTKAVWKPLMKGALAAFPCAVIANEGDVTCASAWRLQAAVSKLDGGLSGVVRAQAEVLLSLVHGGRTLCAAEGAGSAQDTEFTVVTTTIAIGNNVSTQSEVSYAPFLGLLADSTDPFSVATREACVRALSSLSVKAQDTFDTEEERSLWENARAKAEKGESVGLTAYLEKYPSGPHAAAAKEQLAGVEIDAALKTQDAAKLKQLLQAHPNHTQAGDILAMLEQQEREAQKEAFGKDTASGTENAFEQFARDNPGSPHAAEAAKRAAELRKKREEAEYAPYLIKDSKDGYAEFVQKYPINANVGDAQRRIEGLCEMFLVQKSDSPDGKVDIKELPKALSPVLFRAGVGARYPVVAIESEWVKIQLDNGNTGYVFKSNGRIGRAKEL